MTEPVIVSCARCEMVPDGPHQMFDDAYGNQICERCFEELAFQSGLRFVRHRGER